MDAKKWYIEHWYVDHWDDAEWTTDDGPERFDSREAAQRALDDFINDSRDAEEAGDLFEAADPDDYRIKETT